MGDNISRETFCTSGLICSKDRQTKIITGDISEYGLSATDTDTDTSSSSSYQQKKTKKKVKQKRRKKSGIKNDEIPIIPHINKTPITPPDFHVYNDDLTPIIEPELYNAMNAAFETQFDDRIHGNGSRSSDDESQPPLNEKPSITNRLSNDIYKIPLPEGNNGNNIIENNSIHNSNHNNSNNNANSVILSEDFDLLEDNHRVFVQNTNENETQLKPLMSSDIVNDELNGKIKPTNIESIAKPREIKYQLTGSTVYLYSSDDDDEDLTPTERQRIKETRKRLGITDSEVYAPKNRKYTVKQQKGPSYHDRTTNNKWTHDDLKKETKLLSQQINKLYNTNNSYIENNFNNINHEQINVLKHN